MTNLPALPAEGELVTPDQAAALEAAHAQWVASVDDPDALLEAGRRIAAYEGYVQKTSLQPYAQGMARRNEARVGEVFGPAPGRGRKEMNTYANSFERPGDREDFRKLARAVKNGLLDYLAGDGVWRTSRRALVAMIERGDFNASLGALKGSVHTEWYTPARYIEAARFVLGGIDLDPASSSLANQTVNAKTIYTQVDNGLERNWQGRVWCNPPYGKGTGLFASKLVAEYEAGRVSAGILLINAYGMDASWFQPLYDHLLCFTDHRIIFTSPQRDTGGPANGNLFVYVGDAWDTFTQTFSEFGTVVQRRVIE